MNIKMLESKLWADVSPHLPHRNLIKDKEYSDLPESMTESIIRQKFGVEVKEGEELEEEEEEEEEKEEELVTETTTTRGRGRPRKDKG